MGRGARKKAKKAGHRGGAGMAGTGKGQIIKKHSLQNFTETVTSENKELLVGVQKKTNPTKLI